MTKLFPARTSRSNSVRALCLTAIGVLAPAHANGAAASPTPAADAARGNPQGSPGAKEPPQAPAATPATATGPDGQAAPIASGEIVPTIDKSCWIVFQDRNNNYWFGSDGHGVSRFDGKNITRFTTKDGLRGDQIRGIQQHASGDILITTVGGISKFDGRRFVTLPATECDFPGEGWRLGPDDVWLPWQPNQKGPYRYDGKTLYHLRFPKHSREDEFGAKHPNLPWSAYEVYCVYKDRRGHMWFGTANSGICRFDGKSLDWMYEHHLIYIGDSEESPMFGIRSMIEDKDGAFWFCNTKQRYRIEPSATPENGSGTIRYSREAGIDLAGTVSGDKFFYFMSIVEDGNGNLWMAPYSGGVWRYDGKAVTHYPVKDGDQDVTMFSIVKDNRGDLWVGTHEHGPYKFDGKAFRKFEPQ
ncbi:MAG: two-component regulator propeller domain-containing protein [Gemmataceae bacterium]